MTEEVGWSLAPAGEGCRVTLTSTLTPELRETALATRRDWLERTDGLEAFLRHGRPMTCPRPRDIGAATELPADGEALWARISDPEVQRRCLPLRGGLTEAGAAFDLRDGVEPQVLRVAEVRLRPHELALSFRLGYEDWLEPTDCSIRLRAGPGGTVLAVSHVGWEGISLDCACRGQQRRRLASVWYKALLEMTLGLVRSWRVPTVGAAELRERLGGAGWFVFDSNRLTLWEQGHIPGAAFVGQEGFAPGALPPEKGANLAFYCRDSM
jgi:hypothetical protein